MECGNILLGSVPKTVKFREGGGDCSENLKV